MQHKKVIIIDWSHCIEDFLNNIGLTFKEFTTQMNGGWLFGYVEAFGEVDTDAVFCCFSLEIDNPAIFIHTPTNAQIIVLPAPLIYKQLRKKILNPYTSDIEKAAGIYKGIKKVWLSILLKIAPYCSTPLILLSKELIKGKYNAVLCQEYENPRFDLCMILGKILNIPVFASFQGGNWQMSPLEKYFRNASINNCKGLIIASMSEINRVKEKYHLSPDKISRIFNPINLSHIVPINRSEARIKLNLDKQQRIAIWHGRIDYYRKGLDILLKAWEILNTLSPKSEYHLILVGSGNNDKILKEFLSFYSFKNVTWINEYIIDRERIYTYLTAADVYVFPSRNEGFPVAPLEAMACSLPIIAADASGIPDLLENGEHDGGMLIKKDDSEALATNLKLFLDQPEYADSIGINAKNHIMRDFSKQEIGQQLYQFIFKK